MFSGLTPSSRKLVVPSVPHMHLIWFVESVTRNGRPELALRLCEHLRGRGPTGWTTVAAYHAIRKSQSAAAARDWLRANATPADLDVLAKQALLESDYELALDLPDHPDPTKNDILYMIRAACLLYQPDSPPERRAALIKYFEGRPKTDFVVYGLFFLGQVDRPTLFAEIKDLSYVSSVGWILGLTSAHEGRYEAGATSPLATGPPASSAAGEPSAPAYLKSLGRGSIEMSTSRPTCRRCAVEAGLAPARPALWAGADLWEAPRTPSRRLRPPDLQRVLPRPRPSLPPLQRLLQRETAPSPRLRSKYMDARPTPRRLWCPISHTSSAAEKP